MSKRLRLRTCECSPNYMSGDGMTQMITTVRVGHNGRVWLVYLEEHYDFVRAEVGIRLHKANHSLLLRGS